MSAKPPGACNQGSNLSDLFGSEQERAIAALRRQARSLEAKSFRCMKVDGTEWQRELISQTELFLKLHDRLPKELIFQRELLISRL